MQPRKNDIPYFVLVQNNPGLDSGAPVVPKGVQIGEITEKDLTPKNVVRLKIEIEEKYAPLIREGVVFYSGDGQLNYMDLSDGEGEPPQENSDVLGFASETEFQQWRTVECMRETYDLIRKYLNNLSQEYEDTRSGNGQDDSGKGSNESEVEMIQGKKI